LEESGQSRIVCRVIGSTAVVTPINDVETSLAYSERALHTESLTRDDGGAFGIEDASTGTAMMFSTKCRESVATQEAFLADFIRHPKLLAQNLFPHLFEACIDDFRSSFVGRCAWNS
jgi:hypothetical protein